MKITMDKDRRVLRIETDEFSVKLNGKSNTVYRDMLAPMGVELRFEEVIEAPPSQSAEKQQLT
jgi:hypothetical protein